MNAAGGQIAEPPMLGSVVHVGAINFVKTTVGWLAIESGSVTDWDEICQLGVAVRGYSQ